MLSLLWHGFLGQAPKIPQAPASLTVWPEEKSIGILPKHAGFLPLPILQEKQHDVSKVDHHYVLGVGGQGLED